jgi:Zn finger protein HypA/HybF involved in hydrogenase expression
MAHSKNNRLRCPKCGSFDFVRCGGGRVKIFYRIISVEYILRCRNCGLVKSRTVFSLRDKYIKMHGLSCPFCGSGRKNHHFKVNFKELTLARSAEEMNRRSEKRKKRNNKHNGNGNGNGKNRALK